MKEKKYLEQDVCKAVARIIKEATGRGPVLTEAFLNENNILIIVSGFMLPIEIEMSASEKGNAEVRSSRVAWAIAKKDQYIEKMSKLLNRRVTELFFDCNPKTNTLIGVMLFQ